MEQPIRVLYIVGGRLNYGGIETFIMNYYRNIDKTKIQIDFIVNGYEKGIYDDEIKSMGGKIYNTPSRKRHFLKHTREIKKILKSGKYKIVHVHANQMNGLFLKIAKKCKVPIRISHCHTANVTYNSKLKKIIFEHYKAQVKKYATDYWACSKLAGEWLYGKENVKKDKVVLVKNAIELDKYKFNKDTRRKLRKKYGIEDETVIGHIGRFFYEKNHKFIINLFDKYHEINPNSKLILIGEGRLQEKIKNKIREKNLQNDVIIINRANNVNEILNIFDIFILPSLFEGLPFVTIEAQANGLPCILSTGVSKEVKISKNVQFSVLDINKWLKTIQEFLNKKSRNVEREYITDMGYNIKKEVKKLEKRYYDLYNQKNNRYKNI